MHSKIVIEPVFRCTWRRRWYEFTGCNRVRMERYLDAVIEQD
jgi:hypothetical protein